MGKHDINAAALSPRNTGWAGLTKEDTAFAEVAVLLVKSLSFLCLHVFKNHFFQIHSLKGSNFARITEMHHILSSCLKGLEAINFPKNSLVNGPII